MSRESILTHLTLIGAVGGAVFFFNNLVMPLAQADLKDDLKAHIDNSIVQLRADIKTDMTHYPTKHELENAQLKSMLYASERMEQQDGEFKRKFEEMEMKIKELKAAAKIRDTEYKG